MKNRVHLRHVVVSLEGPEVRGRHEASFLSTGMDRRDTAGIEPATFQLGNHLKHKYQLFLIQKKVFLRRSVI